MQGCTSPSSLAQSRSDSICSVWRLALMIRLSVSGDQSRCAKKALSRVCAKIYSGCQMLRQRRLDFYCALLVFHVWSVIVETAVAVQLWHHSRNCAHTQSMRRAKQVVTLISVVGGGQLLSLRLRAVHGLQRLMLGCQTCIFQAGRYPVASQDIQTGEDK